MCDSHTIRRLKRDFKHVRLNGVLMLYVRCTLSYKNFKLLYYS